MEIDDTNGLAFADGAMRNTVVAVGGIPLVADGLGQVTPDGAIYVGKATGPAPDPNAGAAPGRYVLVRPVPEIGYYFSGSNVYFFHSVDAVNELLEFKESPQFILKVDVDGPGDARCAGYIQATEAQKYFGK